MGQKCPVDVIKMGVRTFKCGTRLTEGLTLETTHNGYKVAQDWDEERDQPETSLLVREKRHVWKIFIFTPMGEEVGQVDMSTDWEPIPTDTTVMPSNWKAEKQVAQEKPRPFATITVPKKVE